MTTVCVTWCTFLQAYDTSYVMRPRHQKVPRHLLRVHFSWGARKHQMNLCMLVALPLRLVGCRVYMDLKADNNSAKGPLHSSSIDGTTCTSCKACAMILTFQGSHLLARIKRVWLLSHNVYHGFVAEMHVMDDVRTRP